MSVYFMDYQMNEIMEYDSVRDALNEWVDKDYIKVKLDDIYPPVKLPIIGEKSVFDIIYALTGDEGTVTLIDEEIDFLEDEILTELEEYVYFEGYLGYFSYNKEILEERKEGKF